MICVSLGNINTRKALEIAGNAEMIEIRADLLDEGLIETLLDMKVKKIFTCRPGKFTEKKREALFILALQKNVNYIDIEFESEIAFSSKVSRWVKDSEADLIISYHNFDHTPSLKDLENIYDQCFEKGADLAKLATMIHSKDDILNLFSLYNKEKRKVLIGMGQEGMITRVAALTLGSEFTFVAPHSGGGTAPGQITDKEMKTILRILNNRKK